MTNKTKILFVDVETSGYDQNNMMDRSGNGKFQMTSLGAIVVNATTLKELDSFYTEFKYIDGCAWSDSAERIHGLSKAHLDEHGVEYSEGFVQFTEFLVKHFDPSRAITLGGHNVSTFDRHFLIKFFEHNEAAIQLSGHCVDSYTLGKVLLDANNSNELFEQVGIDRDTHNALEDARASLKAVRLVRNLYKTALNTQLA
jgi:inhibitor of KinA sporulation pathway (predicted exonuclease)